MLAARGCRDGSIVVSDQATNAPVRTLQAHHGPVLALCAVGDAWLASAGEDRVVRLWRLSDGALERVLTGRLGAVRALCELRCSRGRPLLASGAEDGSLPSWRQRRRSPAR